MLLHAMAKTDVYTRYVGDYQWHWTISKDPPPSAGFCPKAVWCVKDVDASAEWGFARLAEERCVGVGVCGSAPETGRNVILQPSPALWRASRDRTESKGASLCCLLICHSIYNTSLNP